MRLASGIEILDINSILANGPGITHPAILWDENNMALIDGGLPSQWQDILDFSSSSGVPFERLNHVIITHSDMDHIGCLSSLVAKIGHKVEVIAHDKEKPYIECDVPPIRLAQMEAGLSRLSGDQYSVMKGLYDNLKANYKNFRLTVDRTVNDGEDFPYCGGITVIHTPGHTPGHICLYQREHKILFAGDCLNVDSGQLVRAPGFTMVDPASYPVSIKKLMKYDIETVVCFHGGLFSRDVNNRIAEIAREL